VLAYGAVDQVLHAAAHALDIEQWLTTTCTTWWESWRPIRKLAQHRA